MPMTNEELFTTVLEDKNNIKAFRRRACQILGSTSADADDAVSDMFLKAWCALPNFRNQCSITTWMFTILNNICCNRILKMTRFKFVSQNHEEVELSNMPCSDEDELASKEELLHRLEIEIAKLPPATRDAIVTGYLQGLSGAEAATMLGCSVNTYNQRIAKAKQILKKRLIQ